MRYELTDGEWGVIKPMLPNKPRGVPRADDRRTLNGIFWVLQSGAPWRDLPRCYGPPTTCYNDGKGLPVRIGLTSGEAHDNRLCTELLRGLPPQTLLLADRGYDADWIRAFVAQRGAWANIPPKRNRREPICFSPHLYRARNLVDEKEMHCSIGFLSSAGFVYSPPLGRCQLDSWHDGAGLLPCRSTE